MAYDLKSIRAPRLTGLRLAAVVRLVENPLTRPLVASALLNGTGLPSLRRAVLDEAPAHSPAAIRPPYPNAEKRDVGDAIPSCNLPPAATSAPSPSTSREAKRGAFAFESISDFERAYRQGRCTPDQVAERLLSAIEESNARDPALRAMTAHHADDIRAQARTSSKRHAAGRALGPLDGVPIAVKEELDVRGYPTTVGTRFLKDVAADDATVVRRLRAAGALLVGKANMHEIGIDATGFNAHHGTARNPYEPGCFAGGSSSGPAAAVAAGLCPLAVGADGGGSIRIPAALCGIVGLKPTFGRVSEKGAYPLCWSVAHVGPMGATVEDVAIGYEIMAGVDEADPQTFGQPPVAGGGARNEDAGRASHDPKDLRGLRVGMYLPWFEDATADVVRVCRQTVSTLEALGAEIVPIELPDLELCRVAHLVTIVSEMVTFLDRHMARHRRDFSMPVRLNLAAGRMFTARDYIRAQQIRARFAAHAQTALSVADVIVTPATACTAPRIRPGVLARGEVDLAITSALMRYAFPWNMTGHPAIAFPVGYDAQGLPIGLQVVGALWAEKLLLRIARVATAGMPRRSPAVHFSLLGGPNEHGR